MKKINYFPCPTHSGNALSIVCTDRFCYDNALICTMCEHANHTSHNTIPLKIFLQQIEETASKEDYSINASLFDISLFLERSHNNCLNIIHTFNDQLNNIMKQLTKKVDLFYLDAKNQLKQFANSQIPISHILDSLGITLDFEDFKKNLQLILDQYSFNANGTQRININQAIMTTCDIKTQQLNDKLIEIVNDVESKYDVITNQFKMLPIKTPLNLVPSFSFSTLLKGTNITVSVENLVAEQKTSESNGQRFVLCEPSIPKTGITRFGFKVVKYAGWIGVGVCHKETIVNAQYKFNYTNIGHGSYLISNNAYSWSHLQKELNSAHKSFDFAVGDIIIVEVDISKKKITWNKKKTATKFCMNLDVSLDLYPCANLCSPGDTVEIINKVDLDK